jgi:hypothetical protein
METPKTQLRRRMGLPPAWRWKRGVVGCVHGFWPVFLAWIPHPIDWGRAYAPRLAGFPVNICYADRRGELSAEYSTTVWILRRNKRSLVGLASSAELFCCGV